MSNTNENRDIDSESATSSASCDNSKNSDSL